MWKYINITFAAIILIGNYGYQFMQTVPDFKVAHIRVLSQLMAVAIGMFTVYRVDNKKQ